MSKSHDLRCSCGSKLAEYDDYSVRIMDRKCKTVTVLAVVDGKLIQKKHWEMSFKEQYGELYGLK